MIKGQAWSPETAKGVAESLGLLAREYESIESALGRVPNVTELTIFAAMWSEHCAYKSTRQWLGQMPKESPRVLAGPGSHAGVVDVGEGYAVAFKIESHNHPSAVEPYQGAATGVGGILRDIIAQGARPVAVMDSLCFGLPTTPKNRLLRDGVVAGIAGYGNAFGVANIGGRTVYDERYEGNPLVNALAVGLIKPDEMRTACAAGVGNAVIYVGATTGRDGILGAAFASEELADDHVESRSHVQVGDPFAGKRLLEACLSFTPAMGLVACQDMGASGISCGVFEMAAAGNVGMDIDLSAVPLREANMSAHDILVSESQERFLFVVEHTKEQLALQHFRALGVHAAIIGRITAGERVRVRLGHESVVDLPAELVAGGAPLCNWPIADALPPCAPLDFAAPNDLGKTMLALLASPSIANQEGLYQRYDQSVGNRTVRGPGSAEAGVQKLPGSRRGYALCITGRGEICSAEPFLGAQAALADGMRRLACVGAEMVAITDGLNSGSPRNPEENRRLERVIAGLAEGLCALDVPVTGGNVSLYNESSKGAIPPTPMVGSLGLIEDVRKVPTNALQANLVLFMLALAHTHPVASHYGQSQLKKPAGLPHVDLPAEKRLASFMVQQINAGRVVAAKASDIGGLGVALAKLCLRGGVGVHVKLPACERPDWLLFGEYAASLWAAVPQDCAETFAQAAANAGVACTQAGIGGGAALCIDAGSITLMSLPLNELAKAYGIDGTNT